MLAEAAHLAKLYASEEWAGHAMYLHWLMAMADELDCDPPDRSAMAAARHSPNAGPAATVSTGPLIASEDGWVGGRQWGDTPPSTIASDLTEAPRHPAQWDSGIVTPVCEHVSREQRVAVRCPYARAAQSGRSSADLSNTRGDPRRTTP